MKKTIFLAFLAFAALASCSKEPGSVSGNIFYKYNDFVGNKPDAGTSIKLYNVDKGAESAAYEVTSDVQGNYKIESVAPDTYLAFIESKATTAQTIDVLEQLQNNAEEVKEIFGMDVAAIKKDIEDYKALQEKEAAAIDAALSSESADKDKLLKDYEDILKEQIAKAKALGDKIPEKLAKLLKLDLKLGYGPKFEIKKLVVEEKKNLQNNTDFGVTYK